MTESGRKPKNQAKGEAPVTESERNSDTPQNTEQELFDAILIAKERRTPQLGPPPSGSAPQSGQASSLRGPLFKLGLALATASASGVATWYLYSSLTSRSKPPLAQTSSEASHSPASVSASKASRSKATRDPDPQEAERARREQEERFRQQRLAEENRRREEEAREREEQERREREREEMEREREYEENFREPQEDVPPPSPSLEWGSPEKSELMGIPPEQPGEPGMITRLREEAERNGMYPPNNDQQDEYQE